MKYNVAIILNNTLESSGIKLILMNSFSLSPISFTSPGEISDSGNDNFDIYFTDYQQFITNLDFFLPRKQKVILVNNSNNSINDLKSLNALDSESNIIDYLNEIFASIEQTRTEPNSELSQREIEVLRLIASGLMNKEIADKLNISINTVLSHRKNITTKLGIRSVSGLSFYAMMNGIVAPK